MHALPDSVELFDICGPLRYFLQCSTQAIMCEVISFLSYHLFYKRANGVGRLGVIVRSLAEMVNKDELARAFHPVQGKK